MSVFLACAVEAVEALTIVLAVGATRGYPSALGGAGAAALALAMAVAALGPAITQLPIDALRVVVGGLLLVFGLQWLSKAILRMAGLKAKHDELAVYASEVAAARAAAAQAAGFDGYSFAIAFKGVLLEGLEVAFIVLTFGANQHRIALAAAAAAAAVALVIALGAAARAPLSRAPENAMKLAVGLMLCSFGTFWGAEGAGAHWPAGEAALLAIVPALLALALALGARPQLWRASPEERRRGRRPPLGVRRRGQRAQSGGSPRRRPHPPSRAFAAALAFALPAWRFVAGEDWVAALAVACGLALTALVASAGAAAWWAMPVMVASALTLSIRRSAPIV